MIPSPLAVLGRPPVLLAAGALHVTVDALNELAEEQKQRVAEWIIALHAAFPRTSVLACHRQYNYVPGLLPFPVVTLQKVEEKQARDYVARYLHERQVPNHEELAKRLVKLLLEDPEHQRVRDLAQTPLFLWMIVERYRQTQVIPENRGRLFDDFAHWYLEERHYAEHAEPVERRRPYEDKAALLGALGYELVQRSATDLSEDAVESLVPEEIAGCWQDVLEEIVNSEMLLRADGRLRFLHQSFQEYFAARHFLDHEARDSRAIRDKVWQFGWHDTFAVLMGFAGDAPEIVGQVIEAALEVNPTLTARCLRMAEVPDERLLDLFVQQQETTLRNDLAGGFAHRRSAQALVEHGRGPTRKALLRVAGDAGAPAESRAHCLNRLASMPGQARFEPVAAKIRNELSTLLEEIFDQDAPTDVHKGAIDAVVTAKLSDLSAYLLDLVQRGEWPLCRNAWGACANLGLRLTRGQRKAYVEACQARLEDAERELFQEAVLQRMDGLNQERVAILEQLAAPAHLPLLLRRRFSLGIRDEVAKIVDKAVAAEGHAPDGAEEALAVLRADVEDKAVAADGWLRLVREGDALVAAAAGHRAAALGKELPGDTLRTLFDPALPPDRLAIVAGLAAASKDKSLAEPLEQLIRPLIETIEGTVAAEAFSCLAQALMALDASRGRQLAAVANMIFYTRRLEAVEPGRFPWHFLDPSIFLRKDDCETLLARGGDDAKGAIFRLGAYGGGIFTVGDFNSRPTELGDDTLQALHEFAMNEDDPPWHRRHASAAVKVNAVNLLPWLLQVSTSTKLREGTDTSFHTVFGVLSERLLADVLRAIGYLARRLRDDDRVEETTAAAAALEKEYAAISSDTDRSIVVGVTTALGYLGQWEPILTHLGPGEPWMHEAAQSVFRYWVAKPPEGTPERERAARWIVRRLDHDPALDPQVRSTLETIKERLERDVGYHVTSE